MTTRAAIRGEATSVLHNQKSITKVGIHYHYLYYWYIYSIFTLQLLLVDESGMPREINTYPISTAIKHKLLRAGFSTDVCLAKSTPLSLSRGLSMCY